MKPGDVIDKRYVITDLLTPGGKSQNARVTYRGGEYFLKCFLSPKYPITEDSARAEKVERLRNACLSFEERHQQIIRLLEKPIVGGGNLVRATDFFRERGQYYKVYPLVKCEPSSVISAASPAEQRLFVTTFLLSLRELHARSIVHSDLKPDNLLVERKPAGPVAKLIDFDEAYIDGNPPNRMSGDITYASPELDNRLEGSTGDPAEMTVQSDMFSAGLVVHKLVTGSLPKISGVPDPQSFSDVVRRGGNITFSSLSHFPSQFTDLVRRTVAAQPSARPTVDDLLGSLGIPPARKPAAVISMGRRPRTLTT